MDTIKGNELYLINQSGDVYTTIRGRMMKPNNNAGYLQVFLSGRWHYIHRLVAAQYLTNPDCLPWINHKDGNKANNNVNNLEWSSISANIQHAVDTGLKRRISGADHWRTGKKLTNVTKTLMSDKKKGELHPKFKGYYITPAGKFASSGDAAKALGTNNKNVIRRCNSLKWKHLGYSFESVDKL